MALAARTRVLRDGEIVEVDRALVDESGFIAHNLTFELQQGQPLTVEKIVAIYTSRDRGISESGLDARLAVARAPNFTELLGSHQRAWLSVWNRYDIEMDSANEWTATSYTCTSSIYCKPSHRAAPTWMWGCRHEVGTGRRTGGTSSGTNCPFPTSTFSVPGSPPPYSNTGMPDSVRLGPRRAMQALPVRCFPGKAAPTDGKAQRLHLNPMSGRWLPDRSHLQRHVNVAIAYNVWQHYMVTGSLGFLRSTGAELLIEIARFWSSIAAYNRTADRTR